MFRTAALAGLVVLLTAAIVAVTVGAIFGIGTTATARPGPNPADPPTASQNPTNPDVTFYVVAYHWGWAVFTEDGTEVDKIRVRDGTNVEIYAVASEAWNAIDKLPAPVVKAIRSVDWHARTREAIETGRIPLPEDVTIEEALGAAHEDEAEADAHEEGAENGDAHNGDTGNGTDRAEPLWPYMDDHGFLIPWYGVSEYLDAGAQNPTRVVFKADRPGEYEFVCTNYCGLGHKYMPRTMLVVG